MNSICTIVSKSHLPFVNSLCVSARKYVPHLQFHVLVIDEEVRASKMTSFITLLSR